MEPVQSQTQIAGYYSLLSGISLGDTLAMMSFDLHAQLTGKKHHWMVHLGEGLDTSILSRGWFNTALFQIYHKAGLFERIFVLQGMQDVVTNSENYTKLMVEHVRRSYGDDFYEFVHGFPFGDKVYPYRDELRRRFDFLGQPADGTITVQFSSSHYFYDPSSGEVPYSKRIGYTLLRELLGDVTEKTVVFLGSQQDRAMTDMAIVRLKQDYPSITAENRCGTSLMEFFKWLAKSERHICCESGSAFFTAQLGTPTVKVFLSPETRRHYGIEKSSRDAYEPFFSNVPALQFITDSLNICNHNEDLK